MSTISFFVHYSTVSHTGDLLDEIRESRLRRQFRQQTCTNIYIYIFRSDAFFISGHPTTLG